MDVESPSEEIYSRYNVALVGILETAIREIKQGKWSAGLLILSNPPAMCDVRGNIPPPINNFLINGGLDVAKEFALGPIFRPKPPSGGPPLVRANEIPGNFRPS